MVECRCWWCWWQCSEQLGIIYAAWRVMCDGSYCSYSYDPFHQYIPSISIFLPSVYSLHQNFFPSVYSFHQYFFPSVCSFYQYIIVKESTQRANFWPSLFTQTTSLVFPFILGFYSFENCLKFITNSYWEIPAYTLFFTVWTCKHESLYWCMNLLPLLNVC